MLVTNHQSEPTPPLFGIAIRCRRGILPRFLASKNYSVWAIIYHCLRDPTFSHFSTVPACDRRTDRQTHGNRVFHIVSHGKNRQRATKKPEVTTIIIFCMHNSMYTETFSYK